MGSNIINNAVIMLICKITAINKTLVQILAQDDIDMSYD